MRYLLFYIILFPLILHAQKDDKGVVFQKGQSWSQIKATAKKEHKYIFLDCFATWCGPCKRMDQEVYVQEEVGRVMNEKFISVKVQMDSSSKDAKNIKNWYADARDIKSEFNVSAYPTFIFLTPEGKIAYRDMAFKSPGDFVQIANKALDPFIATNYQRLKDYNSGIWDYPHMGDLARFINDVLTDRKLAKEVATKYVANVDRNKLLTIDNILLILQVIGNKPLADSLARVYKANILDRQSIDQVCTATNFTFLNQFGNRFINSHDAFFLLQYIQPARIDSLMNSKGRSQFIVDLVVTREEIVNKLFSNDVPVTRDPDWSEFSGVIKSKYKNVDADKVVSEYRIKFYNKIEDWKQWARYQDEKLKGMTFNPGDGFWELNLPAWNAFRKCNDGEVLNIALKWSDLSINVDRDKTNFQSLDTRANLLYKLGRVEEAIKQETEAIEAIKDAEQTSGRNMSTMRISYQSIVDKMKRGEPTYLEDGAVWDNRTLPKVTKR